MKTEIRRSATRGHANHGWLDTYHSFSFAGYFDPNNIHFGALRVLNDDTVAPGRGFGTHPHKNMEIISIPLSGDLEHKDSMDNKQVIKKGDVQVMSAGTGVMHSEYNKNDDEEVKFLQIWVIPREQNVEPRYDQIKIDEEKAKDSLLQIVSPNKDDDGVWIHQDAWFHLSDLSTDKKLEYKLKQSGNGVYAFLLEGEVEINNETLSKRDALKITETDSFEINSKINSRILLMEVPMIKL